MKNIHQLIISIVLTLFCLSSMAVPAHPGLSVFVQPDGSTITILLEGDENLSYVRSADGYTLLFRDGYYYYAILNADGNLVASDVVACDIKNKAASILQNLPKGLKYSATQLSGRTHKMIPHQHHNNLKASGIQLSTFPSKGKRKLLMILINFSDTQPKYQPAEFNKYMNEVGYSGIGSFRDYFLENSYGLLDIETTVTRWVTVSKPHKYYGENDDAKAYEAVVEAINLLDDEVDFSQFDNDGDGVVDGIAVIHQGQGEEFSGSNPNNIWSHSWTLSYALYPKQPPRKDGVIIDSYTIQPEIRAGRNATKMSTIGVMCHEFGHNLGAPDYYDTEGGNQGTGQWDLMAAGSWNGTSGDRPAHINAYQKSEFGWVNPETLSESGDKVLKPIKDFAQAYRINTTTSNEFFILENRVKQGAFDLGLPGEGMIVYHVDENHIRNKYYSNKINVGNHQGIYPIVAKGVMSNPNTSACPFPGSGNITSFTDGGVPSAKSWSGSNTNFPLTNIFRNGNDINFNLSDVEPALINPVNLSVAYRDASRIIITWSEGEATQFKKYNVYRNGVLLAGTTRLEYRDNSAPVGVNLYSVRNVSEDGRKESSGASVAVYCESNERYKIYGARAALEGGKVSLSWQSPIAFYDGFETMSPFIVNQPGGNGWSYIDGDGSVTCSYSVDYPNKNVAKSFIVVNPFLTEPKMTNPEAQAFRGVNYMASFSAPASAGATDDWLISKRLSLDDSYTLVFYARSLTHDYGKELIDVAYSKSGVQKSDFVFVNGVKPIELDKKWVRYECTIPSDARYFAIHCQSPDVFVAMVDEVSLVKGKNNVDIKNFSADFYPPLNITGYNIYRNDLLIKENVQTHTYLDEVLQSGSYQYCIESLAGEQKIAMTRVCLPSVSLVETSVEDVGTDDSGVLLFPNPAKRSFNVKYKGADIRSVEVYSLVGIRVLVTHESSDVSLVGLPAGQYIVKVITSSNTYVRTLQVR